MVDEHLLHFLTGKCELAKSLIDHPFMSVLALESLDCILWLINGETSSMSIKNCC